MARRLGGWPGRWRFLDAVNGERIGAPELAALYSEREALRAYGRPMARAEIGCALSHRSAYATVESEGLERAVILEDDAEPTPQLAVLLQADLPLGFDVVSFYTGSAVVRRKPAATVAGVQLHRATGKVDHTVGYLLSRSGARKLLAATHRIRRPSDWPIHPSDLAFYVTSPSLVLHSSDDSGIEAGRDEEAARVRGSGLGARLTRGAASYVTIPLLVKYLLYPERYLGLRDYYRREMESELKRLLPMRYRHIAHGR